MQSTLFQQGGCMDGVTPEAVPTLVLTPGLGSHVWLRSFVDLCPLAGEM